MKTVWLVLGGFGLTGGAAFLVFWLLVMTRLIPAGAPLFISGGVMLLVTGLFTLREAFSETPPGAKWSRSDVLTGRLSTFALGLMFTTGGVAFVGFGWLSDHILSALLVIEAAGVVLLMFGMRSDGRQGDAAWSAVRQRGWLTAYRQAEGAELSADEVHLRENAREILRLSIHGHLTGRTTLEHVEAEHSFLMAPAGHAGTPDDWPDVAREWQAFRSAFVEGDEIWGFNTVSARRGVASAEEGFALLRDGKVVDWFITAVVG
jgi:hypothetical protein